MSGNTGPQKLFWCFQIDQEKLFQGLQATVHNYRCLFAPSHLSEGKSQAFPLQSCAKGHKRVNKGKNIIIGFSCHGFLMLTPSFLACTPKVYFKHKSSIPLNQQYPQNRTHCLHHIESQNHRIQAMLVRFFMIFQGKKTLSEFGPKSTQRDHNHPLLKNSGINNLSQH